MREKLFIAWVSGLVTNKETLEPNDVNAIRIALDWVQEVEEVKQPEPIYSFSSKTGTCNATFTPTNTESNWPTVLTESNH